MLLGSLVRRVSIHRTPTSRTTAPSSQRKLATSKKNTMLPIILAGPSGVGKGTIIERLKKDYPAKVGHSVSHTTRAPRTGEVDGVSYHFVTHERFAELEAENKFVETAKVHTNKYGTTFAAVQAVTDTGKLCLLDLDVQGCQSVRRVNFNAHLVFIAPPSMPELEKRLRNRGTEDEAAIAVRLETARKEMQFRDDPMWDTILINDDLEKCYSEVKEIIEKLQPGFLSTQSPLSP